MDEIKTASGKALMSDYFSAIPYPAQLYIRIVGKKLSEVSEIFENPAETQQLWCGEHYFAGYTHLLAVIPENGAVKVALAQEA